MSDLHRHLLHMAGSCLPFVPKLRYNMVDVDDVAAAVVAVLESPAAEGQRYLLSNKDMSLREIVAAVSGVSKWELPNAATLVLSVAGLLDGCIQLRGTEAFRYLRRNLDRRFPLSSEKMARDLGLRMSDVKKSVVDVVASAEAAHRARPRRPSEMDSMQLDGGIEFAMQQNPQSRSQSWSFAAQIGMVLTTALAVVVMGRQLLGSRFTSLAAR